MASAGVGVGMLEIGRMERVLMRHPAFVQRIFSDEECRYCESTPRPSAHYAARFAARAAVARALDAGRTDGIWNGGVSVVHDESGRPYARLAGRTAALAEGQGIREIALSLSLTRDVAVANAVAVTDEVRPQSIEQRDPKEELREIFRRSRTVIDELEQRQSNPTKE
jgi:holo-[acyl-carrier protein] synthase